VPDRTVTGAPRATTSTTGQHADPRPQPPQRRLGGLARAVLSVVGGLLLSGGFPPIAWWFLAVPGIAAFLIAVRGQHLRGGAVAGLLFGLAFFLPLLSWMRVIGLDAWVALAAVQAGFLAFLGAGLTRVIRLPGWPLWAACLWVAVEAARARLPLGGFPWGRLAFAEAGGPLAPYAALGGSPLVSFVTALAGGALAATLTLLLRRRVRAALPWALALAAIPLLAALIPLPSALSTTGERSAVVAAVQGNVPRVGLDFLGQRRAVLDNHIQQTQRLAELVAAGQLPRPDLVVWPENASDIDPYADAAVRADISTAVRAVGVPTLVGAVAGTGSARLRNLGIVWDPQGGPGESYLKRHPVPFGEYVPFRAQLEPFIGRLDRVPRDFAAGDRPGVLQVGPAVVGDVICFEVAYDELLRDVVAGGADLLVVQTNNATYGRTSQPEQQLAISRLRAVEHGRAVVIAATSGISAVIAPDGQVLDRSADFTADLLVRRVPLRADLTVADRVGAAPEWALSTGGLLAVLLGSDRLRRRRSSPPRTDR
jgi:apolipoprotein N-acyltransferase